MIATPVLVLVATFIVAAFWGIGICVIIDFVPSLKSRASTMQSSDSATKEQARRLRKKLQRVRLASQPLNESSLEALDAATARARMRMAIHDPQNKPRYASTSIVEDMKLQEKFLNSPSNAPATTVIMEPIPKTRDRIRLRAEDDVFEEENTKQQPSNNHSMGTSEMIAHNDSREKFNNKPGYLTTDAKFFNNYERKQSPVSNIMKNSAVLHESQPNLSKKNNHKYRYDRSNSTELFLNDHHQNSNPPTPSNQQLYEVNSRYRPYLDTAIANESHQQHTYDSTMQYSDFNDALECNDRNGLINSKGARMCSGDCRKLTPNEEHYHSRIHSDMTYDEFKKKESMQCRRTPRSSPENARLQNIKRNYSVDESQGRQSARQFPSKYSEYSDSETSYKTHAYYNQNSGHKTEPHFQPVQFRANSSLKHDADLGGSSESEMMMYAHSDYERSSSRGNYSPSRSRSSDDRLNSLYRHNISSEVISPVAMKYTNSPSVLKPQAMSPRSVSSSSSSSSTSSRYQSKLQPLEGIKEMEARSCVEDSTLDSRDLNSLEEESIAVKSDSISPMSCNSMYTNHTPASTPPSTMTTTYTDRFCNAQMKLIRQESEC